MTTPFEALLLLWAIGAALFFPAVYNQVRDLPPLRTPLKDAGVAAYKSLMWPFKIVKVFVTSRW